MKKFKVVEKWDNLYIRFNIACLKMKVKDGNLDKIKDFIPSL